MGNPPDQCGLGSLLGNRASPLLELRQDKTVDRVAGPGRSLDFGPDRTFRALESPVPMILGSLVNPALDQIDLPVRQLSPRARGRHLPARILGADSPIEHAGGGVAGDDHRAPKISLLEGTLGSIESEFELTFLLVRTVTFEAVIGEDGSDFQIEVDLRCRRAGFGQQPAEQQEAHSTASDQREAGPETRSCHHLSPQSALLPIPPLNYTRQGSMADTPWEHPAGSQESGH